MSLELLPPDREPEPDGEDTRLEERLGKIGAIVESLKDDLNEASEGLEALLDYFDIDRLEFEFFRQTGRLHAYPLRAATVIREAALADRRHGSTEERLAGAKEELARREEDINEAVKQLDDVIAGLVEFDPEYGKC